VWRRTRGCQSKLARGPLSLRIARGRMRRSTVITERMWWQSNSRKIREKRERGGKKQMRIFAIATKSRTYLMVRKA